MSNMTEYRFNPSHTNNVIDAFSEQDKNFLIENGSRFEKSEKGSSMLVLPGSVIENAFLGNAFDAEKKQTLQKALMDQLRNDLSAVNYFQFAEGELLAEKVEFLKDLFQFIEEAGYATLAQVILSGKVSGSNLSHFIRIIKNGESYIDDFGDETHQELKKKFQKLRIALEQKSE